MTLEERLWKTFNKALGQYQLIDEDDKILVGLSGGKDSLLLLEFLARRSKVHVPHFTVEALHVRMENIHYETDTTYLQSFCDRLGVPLHVITASIASSSSLAGEVTTPDASPSSNRSPLASSAPGSDASSSSILLRSSAAQRLPWVITRTTLSILP